MYNIFLSNRTFFVSPLNLGMESNLFVWDEILVAELLTLHSLSIYSM